jgi:S1-C subfamily serine protease
MITEWSILTFIPNKKHFMLKSIMTLVQLMLLGSGCISPEHGASQADIEVILHPAATDLLEAKTEDIVVLAERTISDSVLTTTSIRKVADEAKDTVVSVYVKTNTPYRLSILPFSPFGGIPVEVPGLGLGSGFFIHPSGYIVTNNHVVADAEQITILTSSGEEYDVVVVAQDPVYDLALLRVKTQSERKFKALPMGDSDEIGIGDMVIAVGNPLDLGHTVTSGIVSQTYRNIMGDPGENDHRVNFIQTDTAINPGSSGGPLITMEGAWVGVNTSKMVLAQGISFAVPSNQVLEFLDLIIQEVYLWEEEKQLE